jgi:hypothetical protein
MTPTLGGSIDQPFLSRYDQTVQAALSSGSNVYVIVDLVRSETKVEICSELAASTTTLAGTAVSLPKVVLPMLSTRASGLSSLRSTAATPVLSLVSF